MNSNFILKLLCSLPVIFIMLYFVPVLGICLIILRMVAFNNKKTISTDLIIIGIIIMIPKVVSVILELINFKNIGDSFLSDVINSNIYLELIDYGKYIICLGIILLIITYIFKGLIDKFIEFIKFYIINKEKQNYEISKKNDMEIKIKQEKAKNTNVVYCKHCGADNLLTEKTGTCSYCRRKIQQEISD